MDDRRDDADLMLAWAEGDMDAFKQLYARHRGPLYRYLMARVGNRATCDELFQDTWGRVIAARQRYRPQARFSTWLLRIAHNLVVDHYRRRRPQAGAEETERVLAEQPAPAHHQPDHELSVFEQRRRLQRALEQLPDEQRAAFVLRMEYGLSVAEIAEATGVGTETSKSRLRYALQRLKTELAP